MDRLTDERGLEGKIGDEVRNPEEGPMAEEDASEDTDQAGNDLEDIRDILYREIRRLPCLTGAAVLESFKKAPREEANRIAVNANLRLVAVIARRYASRGLPFLDLFQEGVIGLMDAAARFDVGRGCRFSTYASWWIRRAMLSALCDQTRMIMVSSGAINILRKMERAAREIAQEQDGRRATPEEMAGRLSESVERVEELLLVKDEPVSLSTPVGDSDLCIEDSLEDESAIGPEQAFLCGEDRMKEIESFLKRLPPREATVIRYRLKNLSLKSVGARMGVSRQRIQQIEESAIARLRKIAKATRLP